MNISNYMDLLVAIHIQGTSPDLVESIRLEYCNSCGDLLGFKPRIHLIDSGIRNPLNFRTSSITLLRNFDGNGSEVHAKDSVPIVLAQLLILIHLRGFGIRCIDDGEITASHTILKNLVQRIPYKLIAVHAHLICAVRHHDRGGAHHPNIVSRKSILLQPILLDPS